MVGGVGLEPTRLGEAADFKSAVSTCSTTRPYLEAAPGIEPGFSGFADRCLTSWLRRQRNGAGDGIRTRGLQPGELTLYH